MDSASRRRELRRIIDGAARPVSATSLAGELGVSRQVIVGDVALLRAEGANIVSTPRGYLGGDALYANRFVGKIACRHSQGETRDELYTIVDMGGHVHSVIVEHATYGELTGQLELTCRRDVDEFMDQLARGESRLLSELTGGVHLHAISCADERAFAEIKAALARQGFLYSEHENA